MSVVLPSFFSQQAAANRYELSNFDGDNSRRLIDGTQMKVNEDGRVVQIQYPSGAAVRRHQTYVMARSNNASYWFGDIHGHWYPID